MKNHKKHKVDFFENVYTRCLKWYPPGSMYVSLRWKNIDCKNCLKTREKA